MEISSLFFLIISLFVGAVAGIFIYKNYFSRKTVASEPKHEATVLLERIEKVFKVVMAEGYFTEIYNYEHNKDLWSLFSDKKKALVIAKAKVLVGYDFGKIKSHIDPDDRKLIIDYFPEPEVLSMDTDYKFYDIEQGFINRFHSEDYTNILSEAKKTMNEKALDSDLPRIAANQVQIMIIQLAAAMNWKVDYQLSDNNKKMLDLYQAYKALDANITSLPNNPDENKPSGLF